MDHETLLFSAPFALKTRRFSGRGRRRCPGHGASWESRGTGVKLFGGWVGQSAALPAALNLSAASSLIRAEIPPARGCRFALPRQMRALLSTETYCAAK